jgi:glycerol-3-phosphate dehydrogenase
MTIECAIPTMTRRADLMSSLAEPRRYDMIVVGGGATGLGVALDAAVRGLSVVLIDSHDFAHGTSSRSTKLVHGGVRYLAQGNIGLVQEALRERAIVLENAPYVAQPLPFVMPTYHWWDAPFFGAGLKMYDLLAGRAGLGRTEMLGRRETLGYLPTLRTKGLSVGSSTGMASSTMPAWRWHWPVRQPHAAHFWSTIAAPPACSTPPEKYRASCAKTA